jgi:adenosylcobinamide-GDP ribazoletransferase
MWTLSDLLAILGALSPANVVKAMRFWTRVPIPVQRFEIDPFAPPDMAILAPASPIAGALVGLAGCAVLALAVSIDLGAVASATLCVATMAILTGAMHEDALGDVADGFGGGGTRERKLEIMKDPRLGSYGATALVLALVFRIAVLAALIDAGGLVGAVLSLIGAATMARIVGLWPLVALSPARSDGTGAAAGRLQRDVWLRGALVAVVIAGGCALLVAGLAGMIAPLLAYAAGFGLTRLAERQIGGQTGDVCGAATLLAELAFLAGMLTASAR